MNIINRQCITHNRAHWLGNRTGDKNVSRFLVSFQSNLKRCTANDALLRKRCTAFNTTCKHENNRYD